MYVGNGVTKKFPIPSGYDGSIVILKLPNGHGYKMELNEAYYIQDGNIIFYTAIPAGIEISFDINDATEIIKASTKNYVVIHSDGNIEEVSEDPILILEEARNLLKEVQNEAIYIRNLYNSSQNFIESKINTSNANLDSKVESFSAQIRNEIDSAKVEAKESLIDEWRASLQIIKNESSIVREDLESIQEIKREIQCISDNAIADFDNIIQEKGQTIIEYTQGVDKIKPELELFSLEIKKDLRDEIFNISEDMRLKVNEELELLKNLRRKMENDYNILNNKINNRWEALRGVIDG